MLPFYPPHSQLGPGEQRQCVDADDNHRDAEYDEVQHRGRLQVWVSVEGRVGVRCVCGREAAHDLTNARGWGEGCMFPVLQPVPAMSPTGPISLAGGGGAVNSGPYYSHTIALPNAC